MNEPIASALSHHPELRTTEHGRTLVHGTGRVGLLNRQVATAVTRAVGSMWCAYAFAALR